MTRPTVILGHPFFEDLVEELLADFEVIVHPGPDRCPQLSDAAAVCCLLSTRVDEAFLDRAPALEVVANFAVGVDNIDLDACRTRGVIVTNTPDVLTQATAEMTLALLFACARRLVEGDAMCRSGGWDGWSPDLLLGQQLKGRRALVIGPGRIGAAVAQLLGAVGLFVDIIGRDVQGAALDKALANADVVTLHVPYGPDTHHLLDARRLALLGPQTIVVNTARGPVIDEAALGQALLEDRLFAAGLDVYEHEPRIHPSLLKSPRAVLAPHVGSATVAARRGMATLALTSIADVLSGRAPAHRVV